VPEDEKVIRNIAIDRTRAIKFILAKKEDGNEQGNAEQEPNQEPNQSK
jgi:hypothetical protein